MSSQNIFYPESRFGGFTDVDGTVAFYTRVNALLHPDNTLLDIGCGRGSYAEDAVAVRRDLRIFKGKCAHVIGLDVDPDAAQHPYLDEFHLLSGDRWPVADECADICLADFLLEHMEHPAAFFAECRRVLRPGGYVCLRTPNAFNYIALASRLIPNRLHAKVVGRVQEKRAAQDVFPTFYHCNTRRQITSMMQRYGFASCVYGYEAEPSYLKFSRLAYALGVVHQKIAPGALKATLFAFGQKREHAVN